MTVEASGAISGAQSWRRLYLDTAELLDMADGRTDAGVVSALIREMERSSTLLVVSVEHAQDIMHGAAADTYERFLCALERFPNRAVVTTAPHDIEPWEDKAEDIVVELADNTREIFSHPRARPFVKELVQEHAALFDVTVETKVNEAAVGSLSRSARGLLLRCLVTLVRGWRGTDVATILAMWEGREPPSLSEDERNSLLLLLAPWAELLAEFERRHHPSAAMRERMLDYFRNSFDDASHEYSPGMFLGGRLVRCLRRNTGRNPLRSDSVDGMHAQYFPYVDVATCDRQVFACLSKHVRDLRWPRALHLFRNGQLADVIALLATCPEVMR
jgi:hypothetical protein